MVMLHCSFLVVTLVLNHRNESDVCRTVSFPFLFYLLAAVHVGDIIGLNLDLLGFIFKNFKFHFVKLIFDMISLIAMFSLQILFFNSF